MGDWKLLSNPGPNGYGIRLKSRGRKESQIPIETKCLPRSVSGMWHIPGVSIRFFKIEDTRSLFSEVLHLHRGPKLLITSIYCVL